MVLPVSRTVTCCPCVPANVSSAFWPGTPNETATGVSLSVNEPADSDGTTYTAAEKLPVSAPSGSIVSVYVPDTGITTGSRNAVPL